MKKKINKILPKSEFAKNVLTLMTGTTIAQAIPIAMSPILTRLYTPQDFGALAVFVAVTSIFGSIANGRYELAIMLPKKDEDAINIFALGFIITSVLSFFLFVAVFILKGFIISSFDIKDIGLWLYFTPITVFFIGLFNILNYFNNRKKKYTDLKKATILKSIVLAIIQLSVGFFKKGAVGLISGQIISNMFANMRLLKNIISDKILVSKVSIVKIIVLAKRYKKFPKFEMWSILLNKVSSQVPVLLLSTFFSQVITGFYSLSYKLLFMPMSVIGGSISQVFLQESSIVATEQEELKKLTLKTFIKLFYLGLLPLSTIGIFGDYLFSFVFGKEWIIAGEYAQLMAIWIFLVFVGSPISTLLTTLEKQKESLVFNFSITIIRIIALIFGYYYLNDSCLSILLFSLCSSMCWVGLILFIFKLVQIKKSEVIKLILHGVGFICFLFIIRCFIEI